jgi:hypothetical protein
VPKVNRQHRDAAADNRPAPVPYASDGHPSVEQLMAEQGTGPIADVSVLVPTSPGLSGGRDRVGHAHDSSTIRLRYPLIQATVNVWPRPRVSIRLFVTSRKLRSVRQPAAS